LKVRPRRPLHFESRGEAADAREASEVVREALRTPGVRGAFFFLWGLCLAALAPLARAAARPGKVVSRKSHSACLS
jgi:hypothetical protein